MPNSRIAGDPDAGTRSGLAPIRLGNAGRIKSSNPCRGHRQVGPIGAGEARELGVGVGAGQDVADAAVNTREEAGYR